MLMVVSMLSMMSTLCAAAEAIDRLSRSRAIIVSAKY